jgi:hypothetical protein
MRIIWDKEEEIAPELTTVQTTMEIDKPGIIDISQDIYSLISIGKQLEACNDEHPWEYAETGVRFDVLVEELIDHHYDFSTAPEKEVQYLREWAEIFGHAANRLAVIANDLPAAQTSPPSAPAAEED